MTWRRRVLSWGIAIAGVAGITIGFANLRGTLGQTPLFFAYTALAMVAAYVGGSLPGAAVVVGGFVLGNWYFVGPFYRLTVTELNGQVMLALYAVVASMSVLAVDRSQRRR